MKRALVIFLLLVQWTCGADIVGELSEHCAVVCRRADLADAPDPDNKKVTRDQLKLWVGQAEEAYQKMVVEGKFKAPTVGWRQVRGKQRIVILAIDFAARPEWADYANDARAIASHSLNRIGLNLRAFLKQGTSAVNKYTICHELFHFCQYAYDRTEALWSKESTARWVPSFAFPGSDQTEYAAPTERRFMVYAALPFSFEFGEGRFPEQRRSGHPYGASIFFRFLTAQAPAKEFVRQFWEKCGATAGPNAWAALAEGFTEEGEKFREWYGRFAIGCVLGVKAPANCLLPDANKFSGADGKSLLQRVDFSAKWLEHCTDATKNNRSYVVEAPEAPNLAEFANNGITPRTTGPPTWVAGQGGIRCLAFGKPPGLKAGCEVEISVDAPAADVSIQAVAIYDSGLRVIPGGQEGGKPKMVVANYDLVQGRFLLVITSYAENVEAKNYPISLTLKQPSGITDGIQIGWHVKPQDLQNIGYHNAISIKGPVLASLKDRERGLKVELAVSAGKGQPFEPVPTGGRDVVLYGLKHVRENFGRVGLVREGGDENVDLTDDPEADLVLYDGREWLKDKVMTEPVAYQLTVQPMREGKPEGEPMKSPPLEPGAPVLSRKEHALTEPIADQGIQLAVASPGQCFHYQGVHFILTGNGCTKHFWSPRMESGVTYGQFYEPGQGWTYISFPPMDGTYTISAECSGGKAEATVTVKNEQIAKEIEARAASDEKEWGEKLTNAKAEAEKWTRLEEEANAKKQEPHPPETEAAGFREVHAINREVLYAVNRKQNAAEFDVPWAEMQLELAAGKRARDPAKMLACYQRGRALAEARYQRQLQLHKDQVAWTQKGLDFPKFTDSDKDWYVSYMKGLDETIRGAEKEYGDTLWLGLGGSLQIATEWGNAAALQEYLAVRQRMQEVTKNGEGALDLSTQADAIALVLGDPAQAAASLQRAMDAGYKPLGLPGDGGVMLPAWWQGEPPPPKSP